MRELIKEQVNINFDEVVKRIQRQVQIPSVKNLAPQDGTLYGQGIQDALQDFINQAEEIGLKTFLDPNGRYAYCDWDEGQDELLGILGHVDVVPVGDEKQWIKPPFAGEIIDDMIIGRGSLDDKGPMIINLMAVKILKDLGFKPNKRIRIIIGGDEESGWDCIKHYIKEQEKPVISYTPDANFPCIFAEKTILQFDAKIKNNNNFIIKGGQAYNAVADFATYEGPLKEELKNKLNELHYNFKEENNQIIVIGKSSHAMMPEAGINAIARLCIGLDAIGVKSPSVQFIAQNIGESHFAEKWLGNIEDEPSGKLKLNIGKINIDHDEEHIAFDTRIPVLISEKEIEAQYQNSLEKAGFTYSQHDFKEKLYVPKDSPLVKTILKNYTEVTGEHKEPLSSGGGTYARAFDNCVAFGAVFPNMLDKMHQPNECFELKYINAALEIYTKTIYDLTKN